MKFSGKRFVRTGPFDTHLHEHGSGKAVLLLHGSGPGVSAFENWSGNLTNLGPGRHTLAPDLAGFGESRLDPLEPIDHTVWCQQIINLLDAFDKERAVLIGNSLGGFLSVLMALEHTERVAGLVLLGTPGGEFNITPPLAKLRTYEPSIENMREMLRMFPADPSIISDAMVESRHARSLTNHPATSYRKNAEDGGAFDLQERIQATPLSTLARISVPTLIFHGTRDQVLPSSVAYNVHCAIPDSNLIIYGKTGHWVQSERRDWFNRDVRAFLDDIGWGHD